MARPTKQGIDYFPLDCQFDDKIEMYLIESGAPGLGVLISIWQMIYSNHGYYTDNNKDLHLLIKRKIDSDINEVSDCINLCLDRGIFNNNLHEKYGILTSKAIQKRYFEIARKKKSVEIVVDYIINGIDSYGNWVNVAGNATNVKVKEEVKVKETQPVFPAGLNKSAWIEYIDHRKAIKVKPLKPKSQQKLMEWLVEQGGEETQQQIVNITTRNGYTGLFELKTNGGKHETDQQISRPKTALQRHNERKLQSRTIDGEIVG
mgnify:CR=1 FL=1